MRVLLLVILYTFASLATRVRAQSPSATIAGGLFPAELFAPLPAPRTPDSDLAIVIWFDWHDPAGTLRHQVYDRRKGEFTPAVREWLAMVRRQYTDYVTTVRYVDVGRRAAADVVRETVDATRRALEEETTRIRSAHRSPRLGDLYRAYPGSRTRVRNGTRPGRIGIFGAPGASGISPAAPSTYPFPTPFPYPRPHP